MTPGIHTGTATDTTARGAMATGAITATMPGIIRGCTAHITEAGTDLPGTVPFTGTLGTGIHGIMTLGTIHTTAAGTVATTATGTLGTMTAGTMILGITVLRDLSTDMVTDAAMYGHRVHPSPLHLTGQE